MTLRINHTGLTAVVVFALIGVMPPAPAAAQSKQRFCASYADESVEMQRRNIDLRCGYEGLRWHDWWDGHYGWCKDWVSEDKVEEEQELRRIQIGKCDGRGDYRRETRR